MKKISLLLPAAMLAMFAACGEKSTPVPDPDPDPDTSEEVTDKTPGADFFYKGTTMCFASYLQDAGLVYRENGVETDPYVSIGRHGANCVRLQLDQLEFGKMGSRSIDWQTYDRVLADALKAKAQGLEIFLTMKPDYDIYSESATLHNNLPPAWAGKTESAIGGLLYDWVFTNLEKLALAGIYPAIVAVGNEVNVGFLKASSSDAADNSRTGRLLAYGHKAVRDYAEKYNPACLSALHIADPSLCEASVKAIEAAGATDYDVVAISYYPGKDIGHRLPYRDFATLATAFSSKKIMVVETAYTFTTGNDSEGKWMGDYCDNAYNYPDWDDASNAENYTPAKARAWLKALAEDVLAGGGIGLITWGTESLPDLPEGIETGHGADIYTYPASWAHGSTWENNSYWDFTDNNNLHEGIDWMQDIK